MSRHPAQDTPVSILQPGRRLKTARLVRSPCVILTYSLLHE